MMSEEKKIFVDENWKDQVEAEKASYDKQAKPDGGEDPQTQDLPPASFEMLVSTFASESLIALGQVPNPVNNEYTISFEHARYTIDMLQVLEDKTKGNLTTDEAAMLEGLLHQLRMAFVALQNQVGEQTKSKLEL
ncbi:DUF1844 domain-containing protein [Bythopirellula polymerisocia]|uniref:DUF1844 domain-containing protein n=1 Tax=Bythopirellula polymerisocia TaxID=2528003 RepID=A0A5C6CXL3_9BACT|nr:DUF1844 domain-containing protein [Bythopirellula polymerisocia]TWU28277.1 hypothetical protein Pla144_15640 [Bythopirellula polymerisocia]